MAKRDTPAQKAARRDLLRAERAEAVARVALAEDVTVDTQLDYMRARAETHRCLKAVAAVFPGPSKGK